MQSRILHRNSRTDHGKSEVNEVEIVSCRPHQLMLLLICLLQNKNLIQVVTQGCKYLTLRKATAWMNQQHIHEHLHVALMHRCMHKQTNKQSCACVQTSAGSGLTNLGIIFGIQCFGWEEGEKGAPNEGGGGPSWCCGKPRLHLFC